MKQNASKRRHKPKRLVSLGVSPLTLTARRADQLGKLARNRHIMHNAGVIAGTRIPTRAIWNFHSEGFDTTAILGEYPGLTPKDVRAAIEFEMKRRYAEYMRKKALKQHRKPNRIPSYGRSPITGQPVLKSAFKGASITLKQVREALLALRRRAAG